MTLLVWMFASIASAAIPSGTYWATYSVPKAPDCIDTPVHYCTTSWLAQVDIIEAGQQCAAGGGKFELRQEARRD